MKTLNINGMNFDVRRPRKNKLSLEHTIAYLDRYAGRTIYDCYNRPSCYKEGIYDEWLQWYTDTDNLDFFGVSGYNSKSFSLQALYFDGTNYYSLSITKCNNIATLIELD